MNSATQTVAEAASHMHTMSVMNLVVEVETAGLGDAYLERLQALLEPLGIKVQARGRITSPAANAVVSPHLSS